MTDIPLRRAAIALTVALCLAAIPLIAFDDQPINPDLDAIRKSADAFTAAYNAGNAKAIAEQFTLEGEFVDGDLNVIHGREAIAEAFAGLFKSGEKSTIVIDMDSVRLVAPGVLVEEGTSTIHPDDKSPVTTSRYVVVHVKQKDGRWLMASARGSRDEAVSPHEHLKSLAWLVGEWIDESDDSVVETSWRWSEDDNYLLADFDVKIQGLAVMKGTQRVGWDANAKQVRSWVFDSEGGFGGGLWTPTENGWIVKMSGVTPTGGVASATIAYVRTGKDSLTWHSRDRAAGDIALPDLTVKIARKPPQPVADKSR